MRPWERYERRVRTMTDRHLPDKRSILLMYITKVSGHRQATVAIQQSLRQLDPDLQTPAINGFGYTYPLLEKVINKTYMSIIKRTPKVWDFLYDNPDVVKNSQSIKNFLHKTSHEKIGALLERYKPDTIVCTQAFPCGMVADYKRTFGLKVTLIGVLTDFSPHSYWLNEGVDYYVVPSLDVKERFIQKGVSPESIKVYGIPLHPKFSVRHDPKIVAEKLGLDPQTATVLVMGGGQGLGPIKKIVKSLIKVPMNFQVIVLAGVNKKILKSLRRHAGKSSKEILIFEFATNVDELMDLAALIVTKPGGMTTAECLAKGLPMVIVNPIPGQETRNADFLIKKGVGVRVYDPDEVGDEVEWLLKSPQQLAAMRQAAYENAKPNAALDIARLILNGKDV